MLVTRPPVSKLKHVAIRPSVAYHKVADAYVPALSQEILTTAQMLRKNVDRDALARAFEARDPNRVEHLLGLWTFKLSERRNIRSLILKIMQEKGDESAQRLLRMRHLKKTEVFKANEVAKQTGVMVALVPPAGAFEQLAKYAAPEERDNLHMTLAYLGKVQDLTAAQIEWLPMIVKAVAAQQPPLSGMIQGVGWFNASDSSDGKDVLWAHVDMPGLSEFRQKLVDELGRQGIPVKADHSFTPHITLAYVDAGGPLAPVRMIQPSIPFSVDRVLIKIGDHKEVTAFSVLKGDTPGHPFHGNQWTSGGGLSAWKPVSGARPVETADNAVNMAWIRTENNAIKDNARNKYLRNAELILHFKSKVVNDLAVRSGLPVSRVNAMVAAWAEHSSDHSPDSVAMQVAAAKFAGDTPGKYLENLDKEVTANMPYIHEEADKMVRAMYDSTQKWLQDNDVKDLYVFRGAYFGPGSRNPEPEALRPAYSAPGGTDVTMGTSPLTSWTLNPQTARTFAYSGDEGATAYVFSAKVPADHVMSLPFTGIGALGEREVVVMGSRSHSVHATHILNA